MILLLPRLSISDNMLPRTCHLTVLSVLHSDNDVVINALVDMVRLVDLIPSSFTSWTTTILPFFVIFLLAKGKHRMACPRRGLRYREIGGF